MEIISKTTFDVVTDDNGECVVMDGLILLCNKSNKEVIRVPLCLQVIKEFGLQELEISKNEHEAEASRKFYSHQKHQPTSNQLFDKECKQRSMEQGSSEEINNDTSKTWTSENTLALINMVSEHYEEFSLILKKKVWEKVSIKLSKLVGKKITATMCETKWKTLKRTYKSINISNQTSGQRRRYWEFFDVLNDLLFNKPEINPVATCSSVAGFQSKLDNEVAIHKEEKRTSESSAETPTSSKYESSFSRKRNQRQSETERRHQEKMTRLDRFNDIFEKMVEKLPSNNSK